MRGFRRASVTTQLMESSRRDQSNPVWNRYEFTLAAPLAGHLAFRDLRSLDFVASTVLSYN
jgi:hypothetical protein